MKIKTYRKQLIYIVLFAITILLGLLSRSQLISLPFFISTYAGDTLWALMVYWGICILIPNQKIWQISILAIFFSFAIEFSQLYHSQWIDNIRGTKLGSLALGHGFKFNDLICYSVGVISGAIIDYFLVRKKRGKRDKN